MPRKFGISPSFKAPFLSPRAKPWRCDSYLLLRCLQIPVRRRLKAALHPVPVLEAKAQRSLRVRVPLLTPTRSRSRIQHTQHTPSASIAPPSVPYTYLRNAACFVAPAAPPSGTTQPRGPGLGPRSNRSGSTAPRRSALPGVPPARLSVAPHPPRQIRSPSTPAATYRVLFPHSSTPYPVVVDVKRLDSPTVVTVVLRRQGGDVSGAGRDVALSCTYTATSIPLSILSPMARHAKPQRGMGAHRVAAQRAHAR